MAGTLVDHNPFRDRYWSIDITIRVIVDNLIIITIPILIIHPWGRRRKCNVRVAP